jgi:Clp amino terminal domain, pathogenicity island component
VGTTVGMSSLAQRLRDLTEHAVRAGEPGASLRALTALREELVAFERLQVARMLDGGGSFGAVGQALGISRQAAHRRYRDLVGVELPDPRSTRGAPRGRILVTSEARAAVNLAREEATALGAGTVGSEHLLLGIIRCDSARVATVLRTEVTLDRARSSVQPTLIEGRPPPAPPAPVADGPKGISAYARAVFEQSLREAVRRGDGYIGVEHLLLASLQDETGGACRTLDALGVDPRAVREALVTS